MVSGLVLVVESELELLNGFAFGIPSLSQWRYPLRRRHRSIFGVPQVTQSSRPLNRFQDRHGPMPGVPVAAVGLPDEQLGRRAVEIDDAQLGWISTQAAALGLSRAVLIGIRRQELAFSDSQSLGVCLGSEASEHRVASAVVDTQQRNVSYRDGVLLWA